MPEDASAFLFADSSDYLDGSLLWLKQGDWAAWLRGDVLLKVERMPGYYWFLAGLRSIGIESVAGVAAVQAAIDALTCSVVAALGALHSRRVGLIAGGFAALCPTLIVHSTLMLQDTLFIALFLPALLCGALAVRRADWRWAIAAGLLIGVAMMVRAVAQYFILITPLLLMAGAVLNGARPARAGVIAAAFAVAAATVLAPQAYRSLIGQGVFYPTTQTGLHALYWLVPLVRMTETGRTFNAESAANAADVNGELSRRGIDQTTMSPYERDALFRELARERLLAMPPARIAQAWTQGAIVTLFAPATLSDGRVRALPRPSFYETPGGSLPVRAYHYFFGAFGTFQAIILSSSLLSFLSLITLTIGGLALIRRSPLAALGAALVIGYFLAVSGPTSGPKYRMPIQPILIVLAAIGTHSAINWRIGRSAAATDRSTA